MSPPPSTLEDNIDDSEHVLPVLTVDPKSDMEVDQPVEKKKKRKVEHEDVKEKTKKKMRVVLSESEVEQQRGHERDIDVERVKKRRRKEKEKENDKDAVKSTRTCASEDRESKPKAVAAIQDESAPAPPRRKRGRPPKIRPPPPDPHPSEPEGDPAKNKSSSSSSNCDPSPSTHRHPRHGRASPAPHPPLSPSQLPAILPLPLDEFQGMLIESFATSRASSLPASSLYNSIMDARPALGEVGSCWDHLDERREVVCGVGGEGGEVRQEVEERKGEGEVEKMSQKEWMWLIEGVLEEGRRRCGVFGKVESSFKVRLSFFLPFFLYLGPSLSYSLVLIHCGDIFV